MTEGRFSLIFRDIQVDIPKDILGYSGDIIPINLDRLAQIA